MKIITDLLSIIKLQTDLIQMLWLKLDPDAQKLFTEKKSRHEYRRFDVDGFPLITQKEQLDYKTIIEEKLNENGKLIKPISRHKKSVLLKSNQCCIRCNAPSEYLYANNGNEGQMKCKVCGLTFVPSNRAKLPINLLCPHCHNNLVRTREKTDFDIYQCRRIKCAYTLEKLKNMSTEDRALFKEKPHQFKIRYSCRYYKFEFVPLQKESVVKPRVDLSKIYHSPQVLGYILTYHVNYGLSARKTACLMKDMHGISISYQTILNYMESVALIVKPYVDNFPYELSNEICADETYVRVKGKWHYLFFFFDAIKKIITSYRISDKRDSQTAIYAMDETLRKYREIPENLNIVVDGNPIYKVAQQFFNQEGITFDLTTVVGLKNTDPVSKQYRPHKQIAERLNGTFKGNYRPTLGYGSAKGSVTHITLFVAYFNFLRPHSFLEKKSPVVVQELIDHPTMQSRWLKLIQLSQNWLASHAIE